jgi:hypothetical protein
MWWPTFAVLALGGCAQVFGLEPTTRGAPDAAVDAAIKPPDAQLCAGGDARSVDPSTGACYVFFATPMIRDAARTVCQGLGPTARLASIQSVSENTLIASLIGANNAFLGGSDEQTEGVFVWDDGTPMQLTSWNTGEPNNGLGMFEEDCVEMLGSSNGLWNDVPCAPSALTTLGTFAFVCERD